MAFVARATANQAMIAFTSLIVCASFVNADTFDSSMVQLVFEDTSKVESLGVPVAKMIAEQDLSSPMKPNKPKHKGEGKAKKEAELEEKAKKSAEFKAKKEAEAEEEAKKFAETMAKKTAEAEEEGKKFAEANTNKEAEASNKKFCAPAHRAWKEDLGYEDEFRGWYDLQGCGGCHDYCRWVGHSGSGGNPALQTEQKGSYWSCSLAGQNDPYTAKGHFGTKFEDKRCRTVPYWISEGDAKTRQEHEMHKKEACKKGLRDSTSGIDSGYEDSFRGWYDVQGCGQCLDYCRWVGNSGSGGDPAMQTASGESYWSCDLAGSGDPYTAKGHLGTKFKNKKCAGIPSIVEAGAVKVVD